MAATFQVIVTGHLPTDLRLWMLITHTMRRCSRKKEIMSCQWVVVDADSEMIVQHCTRCRQPSMETPGTTLALAL